MTDLLKLPEAHFKGRGWSERENRNVQTVLAAYDVLIGGANPEAVGHLYNDDYRDNASTVPGGNLNALIGFVSGFAAQFPQSAIRMKQVLADGHFVVVHSHGKRTPDQEWDEVMEVFRLENGRISEHWETIEPWGLLRSHDGSDAQ